MTGKVDQYERAAIAWQILVKYAKKRQAITYGQLAAKMGIHPRVCRFFLGIIQKYCLDNKLPPIQSLVVNKTTGRPGEGYIASPRNRIHMVHEQVFNHQWDKIDNPFG